MGVETGQLGSVTFTPAELPVGGRSEEEKKTVRRCRLVRPPPLSPTHFHTHTHARTHPLLLPLSHNTMMCCPRGFEFYSTLLLQAHNSKVDGIGVVCAATFLRFFTEAGCVMPRACRATPLSPRNVRYYHRPARGRPPCGHNAPRIIILLWAEPPS